MLSRSMIQENLDFNAWHQIFAKKMWAYAVDGSGEVRLVVILPTDQSYSGMRPKQSFLWDSEKKQWEFEVATTQGAFCGLTLPLRGLREGFDKEYPAANFMTYFHTYFGDSFRIPRQKITSGEK